MHPGVLAHLISTSGSSGVFVYVGLAVCALGAARLAGLGSGHVPEKAGGIALVVGVGVVILGGFHSDIRAASQPVTPGRVAFVQPRDGETLSGADALVRLRIDHFTLTSASSSGPPPAAVGHVHVLLDDKVQAMPATASDIHVCVPDGTHRLTAELVAENHARFRNDKQASATVTVAGAADAACS